jgi:hypothetical protein
VRFLCVALALVAGCSAGGDNPPTAAPGPASTSTSSSAAVATSANASSQAPAASPDAPSQLPTETIEAVVDTRHTGCNPNVITDGCWLPLYAKPSYKQGSAMNLGRLVHEQCTLADTRGCKPQPDDTVDVVCVMVSEGENWFGVAMSAKQVLERDPAAMKTLDGKYIGFNRASMFRLVDGKFPPPCSA